MSSSKTNHRELPKGWRIARFDEILSKVDRKIILDDSVEYDTVGVRWYGQGAFVRERLLGMDIARKQQWMIKASDVVYNKLFAWKGAFAIADETVDGRIVSDKFPTYRADPDEIDLRFLGYYFQTPQLAQQSEHLSKGAAAISKLTLNPPQFWDLTIPLPRLEEQQRIATRLDQLASMVEGAKALRKQSDDEGRALTTAFINRMLCDEAPDGVLADVLLGKPRNGWSARCDNAEGGVPVLPLSAVTGFSYREHAFKRTSEVTAPEAHYWLREGDLLITRSNTPDLVGHAAIYNGSPSPCIYPDLMMRLDVDDSRADKRFVLYWLRSGLARDYIRRNAKGTSPTMKKISQGTVMNLPFPVQIRIDEQRLLVSHLDSVQSKLNAFSKLQDEVAVELNNVMPSILDKAFKGEL
jgi:type I restriction enzyme, S subunit